MNLEIIKEGQLKEYSDGIYKYEKGHWHKVLTLEEILIKKFKEKSKLEFSFEEIIKWFDSQFTIKEIKESLNFLIERHLIKKKLKILI